MTVGFPIALLGGSIGSGETLLILLVVLMLFGPRRLPMIARNVGRFLEKLRRSAGEFADELTRAASHENPVDKTPVEEQKGTAQNKESANAHDA